MDRLNRPVVEETVTVNTEPLILVDEHTDNGYNAAMKYAEALYEEVQNQQELNRYLSECLVFSENCSEYRKFTKLKALNEVDTTNIIINNANTGKPNFLTKILDFIKKIWGKFVEKLTRVFTTNRYYLEKYKDIILNKMVKLGDITFDGTPANFNAGIDHIVKEMIAPLDQNRVATLPEENNSNGTLKQILQTINGEISNACSCPAEEFKQWAVEYYEGRSDREGGRVQSIKATSLKMVDLYNFCYSIDNLKKALEKDQSTIEKNGTTLMNIIKEKNDEAEKAKAAQEQKAAQAAKDAATKMQTKNTQTGNEPAAKPTVTAPVTAPAAAPKEENSVLSVVYNTYLTEEGTGTVQISDPAKAVAANANAAGRNGVDAATVQAQNGDGTAEEKNTKLSKQAALYIQCVRDIVAAKCTAAEYINSQYMAIIRAHVASYVGQAQNPNDNKAVQEPASNYANKQTQQQNQAPTPAAPTTNDQAPK